MAGKSPREYRLLARYGLTEEQYEAQLRRQDGRCAICGRPPKSKSLAVDHSHKTGRIRGLLCFFCNKFVVGKERVSAEMHRKAAEYLENPPWMEERYVSDRKAAGRRLKLDRRSRVDRKRGRE